MPGEITKKRECINQYNEDISFAPKIMIGLPVSGAQIIAEGGSFAPICFGVPLLALGVVVSPLTIVAGLGYGAYKTVALPFELRAAEKKDDQFNSTPNKGPNTSSARILSHLEHAYFFPRQRSSGLKQMIESVKEIRSEGADEEVRLRKIEDSMKLIASKRNDKLLSNLSIFGKGRAEKIQSLYNLVLHEENGFSLTTKPEEGVEKIREALFWGKTYS